VERGTHRELIERAGLYNTLWRLQAGESESPLQRAG
jgi:ABC-type multidrug transport system fused ATPase/permease subunit